MTTSLAPLIDPVVSTDQLRRQRKHRFVRAMSRIESIDLLRGIVMILMLLDHTRDFTHAYSLRFDPTDLERTSPAIFFTRWVTHFCAPVFVFLAGMSVYIQRMRGKHTNLLARGLLTRGAWLILLELTVVRLGITFSIDPHLIAILQVLWVIGVSMIVLAGLVWLPTGLAGLFGGFLIVAHNMLDVMQTEPWGGAGTAAPTALGKLVMLLHTPGLMPVAGPGSPVIFVLYPLIPWIGVMALGYSLGSIYRLEPKERSIRLAQGGMVLTGMFLILRAVNIYGDPRPWMELRSSPLTSALSFFNTTKYPPSLLYLCMTLGPALLLLSWLERRELLRRELLKRSLGRVGEVLLTFGRVPLFFYLLQWYVAHLIALVAGVVAGRSVAYLFQAPPFALDKHIQAGFSLPMVYLFWILGVILLYFPCRWYARVKGEGQHWWLSYL